MLNIAIGIIIGSLITFTISNKFKKKTPDYTELIKRIMKETNNDLSNGVKKTFK